MRIHEINPIGWANVSAIVTTLLTFIMLLLVMLFGGILASLLEFAIPVGDMTGGAATLVIVPIIYGLVTWVFALIGSLIINLALKWIGGLEIYVSYE